MQNRVGRTYTREWRSINFRMVICYVIFQTKIMYIVCRTSEMIKLDSLFVLVLSHFYEHKVTLDDFPLTTSIHKGDYTKRDITLS